MIFEINFNFMSTVECKMSIPNQLHIVPINLYNFIIFKIDSSSYIKRSASLPFNNVVGPSAVEYLINAHLASCEAIYKRKDFWTVLESKKYDLFVTQLLGSGCDSYIAYKLQVPMIAVSASAMPTWYVYHKITCS